MDSTRIILGPVLTEKSERLKGDSTYTLRVHPQATKVDIFTALRKHFGVDVQSVRIQNVHSKWRRGRAQVWIRKRDPVKLARVTLKPKSKALDLANFQAS
jgi:ribosomal protein L23